MAGQLPAALRPTFPSEKEDESKSLRFVADFQLQDTDEVMQIPITRPGRGAKTWKRAAAKMAAVAGTVAQKSDENLDEILVRVGTYFGRDPNVWTREGEQRTEVVEEGGKRVVKRMQKFVGWKLGLRLMLPLFDPRLTAVDGRPELDFSVESLEMTDNAIWGKVIADQPWTSQESRRRVCRLLEAKMLSPEVELQLEGLHGLWEMVVNKEHHTDITDTQLQGLLDAVLHNDIQCAAVATAAIWTMAAAAKARTSLLERGVLSTLVQAAERCIRAEDSGQMPGPGTALGNMVGLTKPQQRSRPPTAQDDEEQPEAQSMAEVNAAMGDLNVEEQDMQQESSEHSVWAQYQECVLGAFGVLFVDKAARERFIELDPTLSILVRMCRGDVDPESPVAAWVAHRKSLAARSLCMLAHRDPAIRMHIVKQPETLGQVLELMDMPVSQPGAAHVKLCMITVLAIMVLDDPCMEYIRTAKKAHLVFSSCLSVLTQIVDMLTPGTPVYRMISEPRVCLAMAEGLAQAMWGAAYECCLPGGGAITEDEVAALARLGFQCMALQRGGVPMARVVRCLTCTLANMAANEGLAQVMMRPRPKTPSLKEEEEEEEEEEEDYYGYGETKPKEVVKEEVVEEEVVLEPDPSGAGAFLLGLFDDLGTFEEEDENDVRTSVITAIALLSGHSFKAQGEESMWGPFRESLLHIGAFDRILHALDQPVADPIMRELCEIAASYALMQLSTMVGAVEPDALQLFVRLMHEKKANVELVEYMMAGMWILLRTDSNRAFLLNTIDEQRRASTTDGDGNPYATTSGAPLLGEIDQQLELSAAVQESEASIQKAEKMLQSAEASFQSGAVKSGGSVRSIQAKRTAENSAVEIAPEDSRGLKSVKEEGEEEEGEGGEEDKKEGAVDTALNMGTAMATGGHGEWGLQIILDVGFTWLDKLKVVGSEGDEDAPLVKLFEFLVSGLGLLMTDTDVVPRSHDQDVFEAVEYPRGKPLYEDPRGFKTRRQLAEEMRGSTVGFVGMAVRPPDGMEELTEIFSRALDLLVELLALKEPVTAKIIQLTINSLWGVVLSNKYAEQHVLEHQITPKLLALARNSSLPAKVRDSAAGMLCDLFEFYPNLEHMGGVVPTLRTYVHLVNSRIPLLEHRGALSLGRAAYEAPALCPTPGPFQVKVRRKIARTGGVRALVSLVQHTHARYQIILAQGSLEADKEDPQEANARKLAKMFERVQNQLKSIHKVHKKANGGDVGAAHSIDYASREMTMIKALQEKRLATMGEDAKVASAISGLEEDSMDFYEAVVETQVLALKALLNVSTYPKNQVRIAKAGLFTLLGINSFFSSMLKDAPHDAPEHDVLVLSSRILQNVALHPQNRTMLYQAELRGSLRKVELLAEPKLAAKGYIPAWGDEGARTVSETISKRSSSPKRSMASTGKSAAARTGKSTTLEAQTAVPENLRAVLPRDMPKGKVAQDGIKLDDIQRPKVLFPPIEPRSSRGEGTASTIKAEGPGTGGPGTWKRKDLPTKDRFADWAVHTFSAGDTEEGTFAFRDSSDSEDEEGPLVEERMMRVQLPALTHTLRKPMSHMWELPPDHPLRHGKSRWDPRVSEYVQAAEKGQLQASAEHLLTVKDPNKGAQTLMSASLELTQTGMLPPVLSEAVVSERPATPDRSNGRVPVTRFRAEDTIPTALSLSQKVKENRRAKRANEQLEDMQLKIQLAPRSGRTLMHFESAVRDSKGGVGGRPKLTMFEHKEGAQVYRSYMEPYVLPNGKSAFFYYDAGSIHDEVPVRAGARPQRPSTFPSALQRHMPLAALLDVISKPPGSGIDIALLKPLPQLARLPSMHTLPVRNPEVLEAWAFGDLEEINLHFILLVERTVRETTDVAVHDVEAPRPKTPWRLPESIFKPRLRESDSKGFFDTHQIEDRNFEKNWKRVTGKDKFLSFLERESRTNKEKDAKQVEREIHSILRQHYMIISSIFAYYAVTGGGSPFTMELNDFTSLLEICNVPDKESELCKKSDCDTVFIQCNFVENKNSMEAKVATEHSMLRHEFLEALVRLAWIKYGKGQTTTDLPEALTLLFEQNILAFVPEQARLEPNTFRRERLYFEEVDLLLKKYKKELQMMYIRYRLPPRGGGLRPKFWKQYCWDAFVQDAGLLDAVSIQQSLLAFSFSRMMVADEIAQWAKYETMTFVDFLESLGRVADMISWPSLADINSMGYENALQWKLAVDAGETQLQRRPSAGLEAPKTRPLWVKLEVMLDYVFRRLMYVPGEPLDTFSMEGFYKKMKKIDHDLGS